MYSFMCVYVYVDRCIFIYSLFANKLCLFYSDFCFTKKAKEMLLVVTEKLF